VTLFFPIAACNAVATSFSRRTWSRPAALGPVEEPHGLLHRPHGLVPMRHRLLGTGAEHARLAWVHRGLRRRLTPPARGGSGRAGLLVPATAEEARRWCWSPPDGGCNVPPSPRPGPLTSDSFHRS
jgi:hypothetical protein